MLSSTAAFGQERTFAFTGISNMTLRRPQFRPVGAFVLTLLLAVLYFCCTLVLIPSSVNMLSNLLGHALFVWVPIALCALTYAMTVTDSSARLARLFRTAAASTLAPSLAFVFIAFVGFVWLDWKMQSSSRSCHGDTYLRRSAMGRIRSS
jgi:hypothetical protein